MYIYIYIYTYVYVYIYIYIFAYKVHIHWPRTFATKKSAFHFLRQYLYAELLFIDYSAC